MVYLLPCLLLYLASCNPVHMVYFVGSVESGSGTLVNLDVMNVVPYSIDPSVFNIPPQCKDATTLVIIF